MPHLSWEDKHAILCSWKVVECLWCPLCRSWNYYDDSDDKDDQLFRRYNRNLHLQYSKTVCLWCPITSTDKLISHSQTALRGAGLRGSCLLRQRLAVASHMQVRSLQRPKLILFTPARGQGLPRGFLPGAQSKGQECLKWPKELPARAGVLLRDTLESPWSSNWLAVVTSYYCLSADSACQAHLTSSLMPTELIAVAVLILATYWSAFGCVSRPYESDLRQLK